MPKPNTEMTEEEMIQIGLSLADFMNTPGGVWFITHLNEQANLIGQEALIADEAKTPMAYYRGRLYAVRSLLHSIEALAGLAAGLVRERAEEEEAKKGGKKKDIKDVDDGEETLVIPRSGSGTISAPTSFGQE